MKDRHVTDCKIDPFLAISSTNVYKNCGASKTSIHMSPKIQKERGRSALKEIITYFFEESAL